jgi:DNA-binding transcriptional ArsR family regulator
VYNTKNYIMPGPSGDIKRRILSAVDKKPMSLSELSRKLKLRREFVSGYLEAMRHDGEVKVVKVGRSKVYRLKKKK